MKVVKNNNKTDITFRAGGQLYKMPAGKTVVIPNDLYNLWSYNPFYTCLSQGITEEEWANLQFSDYSSAMGQIPNAGS
ncbi:MAG: hypothetical protein QW575_09095 [Thermoproteota archaeon]